MDRKGRIVTVMTLARRSLARHLAQFPAPAEFLISPIYQSF